MTIVVRARITTSWKTVIIALNKILYNFVVLYTN